MSLFEIPEGYQYVDGAGRNNLNPISKVIAPAKGDSIVHRPPFLPAR
jgi:hypothetical protein